LEREEPKGGKGGDFIKGGCLGGRGGAGVTSTGEQLSKKKKGVK